MILYSCSCASDAHNILELPEYPWNQCAMCHGQERRFFCTRSGVHVMVARAGVSHVILNFDDACAGTR